MNSFTSARDAAVAYLACGWQPLPVPIGSKNPGFDNWQLFTCTAAEVSQHFSNGGNVGLLLGTASAGLVDVDIDCPEALAIARALLPQTQLVSGRNGNPRSHWWYTADPPDTRRTEFRDPLRRGEDKKGMLIELRGNGVQTVVPPSIHPEGDHYVWHEFGEPAKVQADDLLRIVQKIAIASLLARYWPGPGAKHDAALPIAGLFLSAGWAEEEAAELVFLAAQAAGHQDPKDRKAAAHDTYRKAANGQPTQGIPKLKDYMPAEIVNTLYRWCVEISPNPPKRANGHYSEERPNPWARAKSAPDFLAEKLPEFKGLAKDLVAPGAITLIDSPKGLGKTQVVEALAVALGSESGVFRDERVQPCRVLLIDRENARGVVQTRLERWGAATAKNLHILTRQDAPDLKDKKLWSEFPAEDYDVLIIDSVGASTEGITEKEGKQTTEVLATLQDLAHRGPAIVLLQNTEKTGTNIRGRGEWADRADIQYEVRDATDFIPSGKRPWWLELPADGAANWAERAARRKGKHVFRLAFIAAKFRLAAEPEPFCLEISLPENAPWTLRDVTTEILRAGEEVVAKATQQKNEKQEKAAAALAEVVKDRAVTDAPLLKTEAEEYLHQEERLSRDAARAVISEKENVLWRIEQIQASKGRPKALYPVSFQTDEPRKSDPSGNPCQMGASEPSISAGTDSKPRENTLSLETNKTGTSRGTLFSRLEKSTTAEIGSQKSLSNVAYGGKAIFADDEIEDAEVIE